MILFVLIYSFILVVPWYKKNIIVNHKIYTLFLSILFALIISTYQQSKESLFDTGAYHVVLANWVSKHGFVKGIANLDPHYGLFSPVFILGGLLEKFYQGHSWQILNGVLYFLITSFLFIHIYQRRELYQRYLFIPPFVAILFYSRSYIASLSPDLWVNVAIPIFWFHLYDCIQQKKINQFIQIWTPSLAFLVWVKWSTIPIVFIFFIMLYVYRKDIGWVSLIDKKWWIYLSITIVFCMFIINFIISGYPLYPFTFISFGVSWQVPEERVQALVRHIYLWGITPTYDLAKDYSGLTWISDWWHRNYQSGFYKAELRILISLPILLIYLLKRLEDKKWSSLLVIYSIIQLLVWFTGSPNPRFLQAFLWLIAGLCFGQFLYDVSQMQSKWVKLIPKWVSIILVCYVMLHMATESGIRSKLLAGTWKDWLIPYSAPNVPYRSLKLDDGNIVHIPTQSKQPWYIPLPSSRQYPVYAIGTIEKGFYPSEEAYFLKTPF